MSSVGQLLNRAEEIAEAGHLARARAYFDVAMARDSGHVARHRFARFLIRIECYDEAIAQLTSLCDTLAREGETSFLAAVYSDLAAVYRELRDFSRAAGYQQRALSADFAINSNNTTKPVSSEFSNRANDAMACGNYELAESLLLISLHQEKRDGSLSGEAADWGSLGVLALLRGETDRAVGLLMRAHRLHRLIGDTRGVGCDLLNLAEAYRGLGRRPAAIRCLKTAINRFNQAQATHSARRAQLLLQPLLEAQRYSQSDPRLN